MYVCMIIFMAEAIALEICCVYMYNYYVWYVYMYACTHEHMLALNKIISLVPNDVHTHTHTYMYKYTYTYKYT